MEIYTNKRHTHEVPYTFSPPYLHTHARTHARTHAPTPSSLNLHAGETSRFHEVERPLTIHVFANGEQDSPPVKLILSKRELVSLEHVLDLVTAKLADKLLHGDVKKVRMHRPV